LASSRGTFPFINRRVSQPRIFEHLFAEAGAPDGVYTNVLPSNDQVAKLIDDPRTRGVALPGCEQARESLASRAGRNLKKSTTELGGSDPFIAARADLFPPDMCNRRMRHIELV
jgi:acyl-CoA reductase-like NAD-dependent aldehyde dehydrogenase